jgi:DUF4097 and DUF4098 domain-containing protein YvlB
MKFNSYIVSALLAAALLISGASASAQNSTGKGKGEGARAGQGTGQGESVGQSQSTEAVVATAPNVNIALMTTSGKISVRGWDRNEVRAQTTQPDSKIDLRKTGAADAANPTMRLDIVVSEKSEDPDEEEGCSGEADVTIDVPRGATVYLRTEDGDVDVDGVAEAHVETSDGRIEARRISKSFEATSVGNDMLLEGATGRARLNTINGGIEVRDMRPLDAGDFLKLKTVSGDILLDRISAQRVEAQTISGELRLTGPLARGGIYDFTTTNGDVTMIMPADSSFKVTARISESGEIITEFPLKYKGAASPVSLLQAGRLLGTYGTGDATISLVSFSGTLRLVKR